MRKLFLLFCCLLIIGSLVFADIQKKTPIIVMGVKEIVYQDNKVTFIACLPPYDSVCITIPEGGIAPAYNVGRFYHDPNNKFIGFGYTDIDVEFTGEPFQKHSITENPNNIMINDYQQWLDYFNLENLFQE